MHMKKNKLLLGILLTSSLFVGGLTSCAETQSNETTSSIQQDLKTKYTLYIGTNDKDTYQPVMDFDKCVLTVTEICVKYTDGCTIYEANGYWKDDKGEITKEQTIVAILEDIALETVHKVCDDVIVALNQNSILIETSYVGTTFYSTSSK